MVYVVHVSFQSMNQMTKLHTYYLVLFKSQHRFFCFLNSNFEFLLVSIGCGGSSSENCTYVEVIEGCVVYNSLHFKWILFSFLDDLGFRICLKWITKQHNLSHHNASKFDFLYMQKPKAIFSILHFMLVLYFFPYHWMTCFTFTLISKKK